MAAAKETQEAKERLLLGAELGAEGGVAEGDESSGSSTSTTTSTPTPKLYWSRWWVLWTYSWFAFLQGMLWAIPGVSREAEGAPRDRGES